MTIQQTCHWQLFLHTLVYIKLVTSNFSYILWYLQDLSLAVSYKCMVLKKESGNNLPEPFYIF